MSIDPHQSAGEQFNRAGQPAFERPLPPHLDPRIDGLLRPGGSPAPKRRFGRRRQPAQQELPTGWPSRPIYLPRRIGVVGLKGGVGKTTLSILMASTYARSRPEPVLLVDADTSYGSMMLRTGTTPIASSKDLAVMGDPGSLNVLAGALGRTRDGLWVLPSGRNPAESAAMDERTYVGAMRAVYQHFPIMLTDCGAGMAGPLMHRILVGCHSLVLATSPSLDGILATHNALRWLASSELVGLVSRSIVVLTGVPDRGLGIDLQATRERFAPLCKDVQVIPRDAHLSTGGFLDLDALAPETRRAATLLAASALDAALTV